MPNSGVRSGLVFAIFTVGGTLIGKHYDSPIVGLASGLAAAAVINGFMDQRIMLSATVPQG